MSKITLILFVIASSCAYANTNDTDELSRPAVELVMTILDYCLAQHTGLDETISESALLDCINTDLEISTYRPFKTYEDITSFISQGEGE